METVTVEIVVVEIVAVEIVVVEIVLVQSRHWLLRLEENSKLTGCLRIFIP